MVSAVLHGWTPASAAAVAALGAIILTIASITHRWIEQPSMRRKTRVPVWVPVLGGAGPAAGPARTVPLPVALPLAEARLHHAPPLPEPL